MLAGFSKQLVDAPILYRQRRRARDVSPSSVHRCRCPTTDFQNFGPPVEMAHLVSYRERMLRCFVPEGFMEILNDTRLLLTILLGLPLGLWLQWKKSRETSWLLLSRKREAARALFKEGAWKRAAPLDFHFTMRDAFGRSVEPCELEFIENRQDAARLLMNRIAAGAALRFVQSEGRYVDARKHPRLSFAAVSALFTVLASVALPSFGLAAFWGWKSGNHFLLLMSLLYGVSIFIGSVYVSLAADAAKYVISGEGHEPAAPLMNLDPPVTKPTTVGLSPLSAKPPQGETDNTDRVEEIAFDAVKAT